MSLTGEQALVDPGDPPSSGHSQPRTTGRGSGLTPSRPSSLPQRPHAQEATLKILHQLTCHMPLGENQKPLHTRDTEKSTEAGPRLAALSLRQSSLPLSRDPPPSPPEGPSDSLFHVKHQQTMAASSWLGSPISLRTRLLAPRKVQPNQERPNMTDEARRGIGTPESKAKQEAGCNRCPVRV